MNVLRTEHRAWLVVLLLALAGCVTTPPVAEQTLWQMKGKLSLRAGQTSRILGVEWRQGRQQSDIRLTGPLGVTVAEITADALGFTVRTSEGEQYFTDEDALALPESGSIRLPWRSLSAWIQGRTSDGREIPAAGISEGQWQIRVVRQDEAGPNVVVIEYPGLTLRLKVQAWLKEA